MDIFTFYCDEHYNEVINMSKHEFIILDDGYLSDDETIKECSICGRNSKAIAFIYMTIF